MAELIQAISTVIPRKGAPLLQHNKDAVEAITNVMSEGARTIRVSSKTGTAKHQIPVELARLALGLGSGQRRVLLVMDRSLIGHIRADINDVVPGATIGKLGSDADVILASWSEIKFLLSKTPVQFEGFSLVWLGERLPGQAEPWQVRLLDQLVSSPDTVVLEDSPVISGLPLADNIVLKSPDASIIWQGEELVVENREIPATPSLR